MKYEINIAMPPDAVEFDPEIHGGSTDTSPDDHIELIDSIRHLSQRARTIAEIIFSPTPPLGLAKFVKRRYGLNRKAVAYYLYYTLGWKENQIKSAMKELRQILNK